MAINKLKDKLANLAGNETLGSAEVAQPARVPKPKVAPKAIKEQPQRAKPAGGKSISKPKEKPATSLKKPRRAKRAKKSEEVVVETDKLSILSSNTTEKKSNDVVVVEGSVEGYKDVLSIVGIKEELTLDVDFKSDELDYVEFSLTTPFGFDQDEVTDFISRTKYTLHKYEGALTKRNRDVVMLASEVKKVEQRMIAANQEEHMAKMIGGMTEEERLIEENMELKVEVNNLKRKMKNVSNDDSVANMKKEIEALRAENHILTMSQRPEGLSLPKLDKFDSQDFLDDMMKSTEEDPLSAMLEGLGGDYDERE